MKAAPLLPSPKIDTIDADRVRLVEDYRLSVVLGIKIDLLIPAGFEFDLSSVPKVFRPILDRASFGLVAPLVHDYLYVNLGKVSDDLVLPKIYCDLLFLILILWDGLESKMTAKQRFKWNTQAVIAFNLVWFFGGRKSDWS